MVHTPVDPNSSAAVPVSLLARWQRVSYERSFDRFRTIIVMIALPRQRFARELGLFSAISSRTRRALPCSNMTPTRLYEFLPFHMRKNAAEVSAPKPAGQIKDILIADLVLASLLGPECSHVPTRSD